MTDAEQNADSKIPEKQRVRIVNETGLGAGTRVEGLENAKIVSVEVLPFGPDDVVTARITVLDVELDIVARDLPAEEDPEPSLPRIAPPPPEPIPVESVSRLRVRPGDVLVVNIPKECDPLSAADHERIKSTMRGLGIVAPIMVMEGGLTLSVVNQSALPLPKDLTPGVSP